MSDNNVDGGIGTSIRGFFGLISFSTILPLNIHTTIEEMAKFTWLWPMIGLMIGLVVGCFGFATVNLIHLSPFIAAALIYSFSIWFTGFHHLDGLIDFGDGLMVHGTPEKKIEVMRDKRIGTGGMANLLMVGLITFASIGSVPAASIFYILIISEMAAKMGIVGCAALSKPFPNGTGRSFIDSMDKIRLIFSIVLTSAVGFLIFNTTGVVGILTGMIAGFIVALIARRNFEYATGDVLGTSNEVARMLAILIMVTLII